MLDYKEYDRWIVTAKRTLDSAIGDLGRGDYNWACFKAHQASEFAVKALIHGLGIRGYGHSVYKLLDTLVREGISISHDVVLCAKKLDKYYIPTRYPNAWVEGYPHEYYTREESEEAIKCAKQIIKWVENTWRSLERGEN